MDSIPMSYSYFNEVSPEMDLLAASSIGDLGLVHRLLQQGANVDQPNESGWTPLMYAAHYGHYNVVKMLIDYGANVNICEQVQGRTPLMLAASCGHTRCLEVLITLGAADIEMTDLQGHNAAYYAIHSGHGRNKIIAKLLKIQGKSRSSSSSTTTNNSSTSAVTTAVTSSASLTSGGGGGGSRIRPLTKGRPEISSTSSSSSSVNNHGNNHHSSTSTNNNNGKHLNRGHGHNGTISSSKISSTTKPDIIISQDNKGPIIEDSSPFPHGSGLSKMNDDSGNCAYYSPYLSLSRDESPIGGQFTPSSTSNYISPSTGITSPFNVNNGLTPQLTFDRLLGKRRLPMGNQNDRYSGQPSQKTFRRDQVTSTSTTTSSSSSSSSSEAVYNLLVSANCSSQQHLQIQQQQSDLTSSSSPSSSLTTTTTSTTNVPSTLLTTTITEELSPNDMNNLIDEACRLNSAFSLNDYSTTMNKKSSPGIIGGQLKGRSPSNSDRPLLSPNYSADGNIYDSRSDTGISCSGETASSLVTCSSPTRGNQSSSGDESSLPTVLSDASIISSSSRSDNGLNRSRSPLPENLDMLLERIGLSQYGPLFSSHGIDLYCFLTLNESDLEEIGITLLGHKRKLYMAQLRFRESVEIASTQERFFADWLLSERENLKKENHELKMKLKGVESVNSSGSIYN